MNVSLQNKTRFTTITPKDIFNLTDEQVDTLFSNGHLFVGRMLNNELSTTTLRATVINSTIFEISAHCDSESIVVKFIPFLKAIKIFITGDDDALFTGDISYYLERIINLKECLDIYNKNDRKDLAWFYPPENIQPYNWLELHRLARNRAERISKLHRLTDRNYSNKYENAIRALPRRSNFKSEIGYDVSAHERLCPFFDDAAWGNRSIHGWFRELPEIEREKLKVTKERKSSDHLFNMTMLHFKQLHLFENDSIFTVFAKGHTTVKEQEEINLLFGESEETIKDTLLRIVHEGLYDTKLLV